MDRALGAFDFHGNLHSAKSLLYSISVTFMSQQSFCDTGSDRVRLSVLNNDVEDKGFSFSSLQRLTSVSLI